MTFQEQFNFHQSYRSINLYENYVHGDMVYNILQTYVKKPAVMIKPFQYRYDIQFIDFMYSKIFSISPKKT